MFILWLKCDRGKLVRKFTLLSIENMKYLVGALRKTTIHHLRCVDEVVSSIVLAAVLGTFAFHPPVVRQICSNFSLLPGIFGAAAVLQSAITSVVYFLHWWRGVPCMQWDIRLLIFVLALLTVPVCVCLLSHLACQPDVLLLRIHELIWLLVLDNAEYLYCLLSNVVV